MSRKLFTAAMLFVSLFTVNAAQAGTGSQFRVGISLFRCTEPGRWEELQNGVPAYRFVETAHGPDFVLMYDAARSISVKLTMDVSATGGGGLSPVVELPPPQAETISNPANLPTNAEYCLMNFRMGGWRHLPYFFHSGCATRNSRCCSIST